jgi:nucleoside-diphosphate-sugar epimerase
MKRTYLVTGATGFIGSNLIRHLVRQNADVHILTRSKSNFWRISSILTKINNHCVDSYNSPSFTKLIHKIHPDYIFHLAAYGSYPAQTDLTQMLSINIHFSTALLSAINTLPYTMCILTGSSSEYGFKTKPMSENDLLEPASFYAATKAGMTHIAQVFAQMYQKPIAIVRPFSVYGPYEEASRLIPTAIINCLKNQDIPLTQGKEKRDFIYIEDFIDGLLAVTQDPDDSSGKIINIGSGKQFSTKQIVTKIHTITKSTSRLLWGKYPNRSWDTNYWKANIRFIKDTYGWKPQTSIDAGLSKTIEWFKTQVHDYEN